MDLPEDLQHLFVRGQLWIKLKLHPLRMITSVEEKQIEKFEIKVVRMKWNHQVDLCFSVVLQLPERH